MQGSGLLGFRVWAFVVLLEFSNWGGPSAPALRPTTMYSGS